MTDLAAISVVWHVAWGSLVVVAVGLIVEMTTRPGLSLSPRRKVEQRRRR